MNIGDYVRTDNGYIGKIISITDNRSGCWLTCECNDGIFDTNANAKSSPNIIDLIEVDDYVNGEKVIQVNNFAENPIHYFVNTRKETYYTSDIKSILTKEQFESMEYKL